MTIFTSLKACNDTDCSSTHCALCKCHTLRHEPVCRLCKIKAREANNNGALTPEDRELYNMAVEMYKDTFAKYHFYVLAEPISPEEKEFQFQAALTGEELADLPDFTSI